MDLFLCFYKIQVNSDLKGENIFEIKKDVLKRTNYHSDSKS